MYREDRQVQAGIIGGSGYTGGELLRLLLQHEGFEVVGVSSRKYANRSVTKAHPNLRSSSKLRFTHTDEVKDEWEHLDLLFLCLPHGKSMEFVAQLSDLTEKIIDLAGDFRLNEAREYEKWYNHEHTQPELLEDFVYGLPELHRDEIVDADYVASPGCTATSAIIPLYPLAVNFAEEIQNVVVDSKVGSAAGGAKHNPGSHHPERRGVVRCYKPAGHRHTAEMEQELNMPVSFSPHAVEMVRGISSTIHVNFDTIPETSSIWKAYRSSYEGEPFIRFVNERKGVYRLPEPKLLAGTNVLEIGFERDTRTDRLVVISALDNLMKGAAGQALQAANLMMGFDETAGLSDTGLHPI